MNDSVSSPAWLLRAFEGWDDPCPLGGERDADGLLREWRDPTYANVPFSDPMPWVQKAVLEARRGKRVVLLTRTDPSTRWWTLLNRHGWPANFPRGVYRGANFAVTLWFLEPMEDAPLG